MTTTPPRSFENDWAAPLWFGVHHSVGCQHRDRCWTHLHSLNACFDSFSQAATLAGMVDAMRDEDMLHVHPHFRTLEAYTNNATSNATVFCNFTTMHEYLIKRMSLRGCAPLSHSNPSRHEWGTLRADQEARIRQVFAGDMHLWRTHCGLGASTAQGRGGLG